MSTIAGLDWWAEQVDWTTGLEFKHRRNTYLPKFTDYVPVWHAKLAKLDSPSTWVMPGYKTRFYRSRICMHMKQHPGNDAYALATQSKLPTNELACLPLNLVTDVQVLWVYTCSMCMECTSYTVM